jgi:hypothetical protein
MFVPTFVIVNSIGTLPVTLRVAGRLVANPVALLAVTLYWPM